MCPSREHKGVDSIVYRSSWLTTHVACSVCITAIWPQFAKIPNTLSASTPTTTYELVGFIVFWTVSISFLFIRPERFKPPFFISSVACGLGMVGMLVWSLAVARGVGPVFS